jgi:hypothetical protein
LLGLERATFFLFFLNKLEKGLRWQDFPRLMGTAFGESIARLHGRNSTVRYRTKAYRHSSWPHSFSASRFTAGASGFLNLKPVL